MRSSVVATLVFIGLIGLGVRSQSLAPHTKHGHRLARSHSALVVTESFEAKSLPRTTSTEARQDALLVAQQELGQRIRERIPGSTYLPSTEYIDRNLVQGQPHEESVGDIMKRGEVAAQPNITDDMVIVTLQIEFTDELMTQAKAHEQEQLVQGRMTVLGRLLALVILGLGAVATYIRADEWTRGYYTGWLRTLTLGAVAAGVAVVWFLT